MRQQICSVQLGVWKSELNAKNKAKAFNELAVSKLIYSFSVIRWNRQELEELDATARKVMHMNQCLHPRAEVERLYLRRREGKKGLIILAEMYDRVNAGMAIYTSISESKCMKSVKEHEMSTWTRTRLKEAVTILNRYEIDADITDDGNFLIDNEQVRPKKASPIIRQRAREKRMMTLNGKNLHGQMWQMLASQNAVKEIWL